MVQSLGSRVSEFRVEGYVFVWEKRGCTVGLCRMIEGLEV